MTNVIYLSDRKSRAAQTVEAIMATRPRVGDTRNGVHVMEERFVGGNRELLLAADGVKQWTPETLFLQQAEHIA